MPSKRTSTGDTTVEAAPSRARARPAILALAAYCLISLAATWPLALVGGSRIVGDRGDAWQTLWGFWWMRESLVTLHRSPMFADVLGWPHGIPLWFQSWDLPSALAVLPLWGVFPAVSLYNLALFASYPLAGFTVYLLCRELWHETVPAFLAGCLYTFSTYHFGHSLALLHIVSMQWSPLFFLGLVRCRRQPGWKAPLLGGVGLALAATASVYHLLFCFVATLVLLAAWLVTDRRTVLSRGFMLRAAGLCAVFLALVGWLFVGMLRAYLAEPYLGSHDAALFSADLQSFFLPNAANLRATASGAWNTWTGNSAENTAYIGWIALALAVAGGLRARAARPWLLVAATGFVLALGPMLHLGGEVWREPALPYAWLVKVMPFLEFGGVPSRFSWLTTFGVAVAAGAAFADLWRRGRGARIAAVALAVVAVGESWPHPLMTTTWATPRPFLESLAADPERWAVLDASNPHRALWHQMLHRHPMVGGYVTRPPASVAQHVAPDPIRRAFFGPILPEHTVLLHTRVDAAIDFAWRRGAPADGVPIDQFDVTWSGMLLVDRAGEHRFWLASDDGSSLVIDDVAVIPSGDAQPLVPRQGTLTLAPGPHRIRVDFRDESGNAEVHLAWQRPGDPAGTAPSIIPPANLRTPTGLPGLVGQYGAPVVDLGMSAPSALARLRAERIRYVIVDGQRKAAATALGLRPVVEEYGLAVYDLKE